MITLTEGAVHAMMPQAPQKYVDAIVAGQHYLADQGALSSVNRCSYLFANAAEESAEFGPSEIVENTHYTAARACQVWPTRFHSVGDVYAKISSWPGDPMFATKLMDNVYGGRMGNRSGTHDGSAFIGRGGLQLTGREEYDQLARATGLDLTAHPELATLPENQDPIMAQYVKIRGLNAFADRGDFTGYVRRINGGTIGMAARQYYLAHMTPVVSALEAGTLGPQHTVKELQHDLNSLNHAGLSEDGVRGGATLLAIKDYQRARGLTADGIAGPATWRQIEADMQKAA